MVFSTAWSDSCSHAAESKASSYMVRNGTVFVTVLCVCNQQYKLLVLYVLVCPQVQYSHLQNQ